MQSDDTTEPVEWNAQELKASLEEWAVISSQMIDLLGDAARADNARNWRPHLSQIVAAVAAFGARCRQGAEEVGDSRADGVEPDEAFELVREQGQRLVYWLQRMMAE
jgi:hypothetical protein